MAERLKKLAEGLWQTEVPAATIPPYTHTHCYWIQGTAGLVLIDTADGGPAGTAVLREAWNELGQEPLAGVYMTHGHPDHVGGARWAFETWGCDLWLHPLDYDLLPESLRILPAWRSIAPEGDRSPLAPGIDILDAPGHTPGQVNIYLKEQGILLAGDNLLGNSTSVIIPPHGHLRTYLATLERLGSLNLHLAAPAHGDLIEDPHGYIAMYREHRAERLDQVLQALRAEPLSAAELASRIYPAPLQLIGELMVESHLEYLVEDQKIVAVANGRFACAGA